MNFKNGEVYEIDWDSYPSQSEQVQMLMSVIPDRQRRKFSRYAVYFGTIHPEWLTYRFGDSQLLFGVYLKTGKRQDYVKVPLKAITHLLNKNVVKLAPEPIQKKYGVTPVDIYR